MKNLKPFTDAALARAPKCLPLPTESYMYCKRCAQTNHTGRLFTKSFTILLVVGVRACRGGGVGEGLVDGGGAQGHVGAELPRLEAPQELLVGATQALLLLALLLHMHLQVGVLR